MFCRRFANCFDRFGLDREGALFPVSADVGQDGGDLFIGEGGPTGHGRIKGNPSRFDRPLRALQNESNQPFLRTKHPFRIHQRRRDPRRA